MDPKWTKIMARLGLVVMPGIVYFGSMLFVLDLIKLTKTRLKESRSHAKSITRKGCRQKQQQQAKHQKGKNLFLTSF
jgi:hypothetical protein